MGLFNKKEKVPEIPVAPTLPELPKAEEQLEKKDLPGLPSFPSGYKNESINQEMVKSAVTDMPSPEEKEAQMGISENLHITEEQEGESMIPPKPSVEQAIPEPPKMPSIPEPPKMPSIADTPKKTLELDPQTTSDKRQATREVEPIFVRIDKFQSAQKNFENIKDKVKEIESVLAKIKGVKSKEEEEIKGWTDDIEKIKARLAEIDTGIFDQI